METMRIKRQARAKRQKTNRETSEICEPSPTSQSESPDLANVSSTGSSSATSPISMTPMNSVSPQYAAQFHSEPEQSLRAPQHANAPHWDTSNFNQHRDNTPQWSHSDFDQPGNMQHPIPYGATPSLSQQAFPFDVPGCSPSVDQVSNPAPFGPPPADIEQYYTNQTQSPTHLNFNAISLSQGLGPTSEIKIAPQPTLAYTAWIDEQRWDSTPASYSQYSHHHGHQAHSY